MNWRREPKLLVKRLPDERKALAERYTIDAEEAERREQLAAEQAARQAEADQGLRPDLPSSEEREEIKQLRKEVYELRRANEILKAASVFFATELDADRPK